MKKKSSSKIRERFGLFLVYSWFTFEINQLSLKSFGHRTILGHLVDPAVHAVLAIHLNHPTSLQAPKIPNLDIKELLTGYFPSVYCNTRTACAYHLQIFPSIVRLVLMAKKLNFPTRFPYFVHWRKEMCKAVFDQKIRKT